MTDAAIAVIKHIRTRVGHIWDDVSDLIIRPPRAEYHVSGLGPKIFRTSAHSKQKFEREDIELENYRGLKLQCSWYRPIPNCATAAARSATPSSGCSPVAQQQVASPPPRAPSSATPAASSSDATGGGDDERLPCVIYLHGNAGCRLDSRDCLFMLDEGVTVFTFDFSGSGLSDGEWVTLGYLERQDLLRVVEYLVASKRVSTIALWGRSMGAVTAVMYAARDPSIAAIVCDSPFSSLKLLAQDLALMHAHWVPSLAVKGIVGKIRGVVLERAGFDIKDLDTLKYARMCGTVPAFIFHGKDDDFVRYEHSQAVADHYAGSCMHHVVEGDHNSTRGSDVREVARAFLRLYLIEKPKAAAETLGSASKAHLLPSGASFCSPPGGARGDGSASTTPSVTPTSMTPSAAAVVSGGEGGSGNPHNHMRTESLVDVVVPLAQVAPAAQPSSAAAVAPQPAHRSGSVERESTIARVSSTPRSAAHGDSDSDRSSTPPPSDSDYN